MELKVFNLNNGMNISVFYLLDLSIKSVLEQIN